MTNDPYATIAQNALTPHEYINGITYCTKPLLTSAQWQFYTKKWLPELGSEPPFTKPASHISPLPHWISCFQYITRTMMAHTNFDCPPSTKSALPYALFFKYFTDYIKGALAPAIPDSIITTFIPSLEAILYHMSAPCLDALKAYFIYHHKLSIATPLLDQAFVDELLSTPHALLTKYSYLCKLLTTFCTFTITHIQTFVKRIECTFHVKPFEIHHIKPFLSDLHQNFQSSISFSIGDSTSYIYKPRSLKAEYYFYQLLQDIIPDEIPSPQIILGDDFGFMEFIPYQKVTSSTEVEQYFYRCGLLLALTAHLNAMDLHHENVIAHGTYPYLVDLETLCHPNVFFETEKDSYTRTGLIGDPYCAFDASSEVKFKQSLPSIGDNQFSRECYATSFNLGCYHMEALISKTPLHQYASYRELMALNTRVIIRATKAYETLLFASLTPTYLTTGISRSLFFDCLFTTQAKKKTPPNWWSLLTEEKNTLMNINIPLFFKSDYNCRDS